MLNWKPRKARHDSSNSDLGDETGDDLKAGRLIMHALSLTRSCGPASVQALDGEAEKCCCLVHFGQERHLVGGISVLEGMTQAS